MKRKFSYLSQEDNWRCTISCHIEWLIQQIMRRRELKGSAELLEHRWNFRRLSPLLPFCRLMDLDTVFQWNVNRIFDVSSDWLGNENFSWVLSKWNIQKGLYFSVKLKISLVSYEMRDINFKMMKEINHLKAFTIFLGKEGCGKTAIFNKLTDASSRYALHHCCPCNVGVLHNSYCDLQIIDYVSRACSLFRCLTHEPLNCIFVLIEFHPRIGSTLVECKFPVKQPYLSHCPS